MALKDLMNNYFYGKQGKADFTVADLPQNRVQLFFTVLKVRWSQMALLNLLYLIIWIPAIVWTALNVVVLNNNAATEGFSSASLVTTWLLILAPCIAITGPFTAGVTYVLRNWARDEHSFVWSDFKDTVKANWKQALAVSCISGAIPLLVYVGVTFYAGQVSVNPIFVAPVALVMLIGIVWSLAEMLAYPMLVTYQLKLKDVIRNSVLLALGKLPFSILIKLITLVFPAIILAILVFLPQITGYALLVAAILYMLFIPIFNTFITVSYANWLCETYLNPRIEGARTNIGLRPENWDDVEFRPEDDEE